MGWAIRRADGAYRCWNRNAKDDVLHPEDGEVWEERDNEPTTTPSMLTDAEKDAIALREATVKAVTTTVIWTLRRLLGRTPTAAEIQTARAEWIAVWKALP